MSASYLDAASARSRDAEPAFDPVASLAFLRAHGVEVETHEERLAKQQQQKQQPPPTTKPGAAPTTATTATVSGDGGKAFTYVFVPADTNQPVAACTARTSGANGDVLPSLLKPRFASNVSLDQETVTRETAQSLKNMVVGGNTDGNLRAPTADALQGLAVGGACERWPLSQLSDATAATRTSVYLYIDEIGALRALPRNARAEALAAAAGLAGVSIHGDAYVGRCTSARGDADEANADFPLAHLAHDSAWVAEARRNHMEAMMRGPGGGADEDALLNVGGDSEDGAYSWSQTDEDVEVRVLRGVPQGSGARKRIKVSYGKGGDALRVSVDGESIVSLEKLFAKVSPDDCSWSVVDGNVLVVTMEKRDAGKPWSELTLPNH